MKFCYEFCFFLTSWGQVRPPPRVNSEQKQISLLVSERIIFRPLPRQFSLFTCCIIFTVVYCKVFADNGRIEEAVAAWLAPWCQPQLPARINKHHPRIIWTSQDDIFDAIYGRGETSNKTSWIVYLVTVNNLVYVKSNECSWALEPNLTSEATFSRDRTE